MALRGRRVAGRTWSLRVGALAFAVVLAFGGSVGALAGGLPVATADGGAISGTWGCCGSGGAGTQVWGIIESASGSVSGTGYTPEGAIFATITGSVSGSNVTIVTTYTIDVGYVATFTGTVSADGTTMSGNWSSNENQTGTWTATLASATGTTTTGTTMTGTTTATPGRRASVTQVICTYSFADDTDVCSATVGDATGQAAQPTGTVNFTSTVPGTTFSGDGSCTLAIQAGDVGVTSCSVSYEGTETQSLQATASYLGDGTFARSTGSTQFLLAGAGSNGYAPTIQSFDPPTLNTTVNIPTGGATVTVGGDVTSNLSEGAACEAAPDQGESADVVVPAAADAFVARAKSESPSVRVVLVRRYTHGGRVHLALRFKARALDRAFRHTTRVQVIVMVTIRPPAGGAMTLYRRETLTLGRRRGAHGEPDAYASQASPSSHSWEGYGDCGHIVVTIGSGVAPTVTVNWTAYALCRSARYEGANVVATGTATLVARGVYSYKVNSDGTDPWFSVSGHLRLGPSGAAGGSGTASGDIDWADDCDAPAPSTLVQTQ